MVILESSDNGAFEYIKYNMVCLNCTAVYRDDIISIYPVCNSWKNNGLEFFRLELFNNDRCYISLRSPEYVAYPQHNIQDYIIDHLNDVLQHGIYYDIWDAMNSQCLLDCDGDECDIFISREIPKDIPDYSLLKQQ